MANVKTLTTMTFVLEGSDSGRLELDALPELVAYKKLVVETARDLWRKANRGRKLPKNFDAKIRLQIEGVFKQNSTVVPVIREYVDDHEGQGAIPLDDEVDEAAGLIEETVFAAGSGEALPDRMPARVIPMFERFGKSLKGRDSITLTSRRREVPVRFDASVRDRLVNWVPPTYEDSVHLVGEIIEADVARRRFRISLENGAGAIPGTFSEEHEFALTRALHKHAQLRVVLTGAGEFSSHDASLQCIARVDSVHPLEADADDVDSSSPPVWEQVAAIGAAVPPEEWRKVPRDLARNFDRYAYGHVDTEPE